MNYFLLSILLQLPLVIAIAVGSFFLIKKRSSNYRGFITGAVLYLVSAILAIPISELVTLHYGYSLLVVSVLTIGFSIIGALAFLLMFYCFHRATNS